MMFFNPAAKRVSSNSSSENVNSSLEEPLLCCFSLVVSLVCHRLFIITSFSLLVTSSHMSITLHNDCVCALMYCVHIMCPVIREEAMAAVVLVMFQYQFTPRPDSLPLPLFASLTLSSAHCDVVAG